MNSNLIFIMYWFPHQPYYLCVYRSNVCVCTCILFTRQNCSFMFKKAFSFLQANKIPNICHKLSNNVMQFEEIQSEKFVKKKWNGTEGANIEWSFFFYCDISGIIYYNLDEGSVTKHWIKFYRKLFDYYFHFRFKWLIVCCPF